MTPEDEELMGTSTEALKVSANLDCPSGTGAACTVPNMPLLLQTSASIDVDIPQASKDVGCYDTSIDTVMATALANRTSTQALTGRSATFFNITAGNNGATPPVATSRSYEQLSQFYRWVVKYQSDVAANINPPSVQPFYFPDALADFSGTRKNYPSGCDPRVYGSCAFSTLTAADFAGAAFRDFPANNSHVTNDYVKTLMSEGFATLIAYGRYDAAPCPDNATITCFTRSSQHKVVFSGTQPGTYPLRINDVGDGARHNVTLSDDLSLVGLSNSKARFPNGKSAQSYLLYDGGPKNQIFFIDNIDGFSLGLNSGKAINTVFDWTWGAGFTSLMPFTMNGQPHMLAYNTNTGTVHFDRFFANANGTETLWSWTWGGGFSHFAPYYINNYPYFVAYNSSTGDMHFDTFPSNLQGPIINAIVNLPKGFTSVVPFTMASKNYLLLYNKSTGAVRFDRINSAGSGSTNVFSGTWGSGWTDFAFYYIGGNPYLVAYNSSTGLTHYDRISTSLNGSIGLKSFTGSTGKKLTSVAFGGPGHVLTYGSTGSGSILRMALDGADAGTEWSGSFLPNATSAISFIQDGKSTELMYDAASGKVRAYQLNLF